MGKQKTATINRNHKDIVFRMLFNDRKNLLSLYNALNGSDYTDEDSLDVRTLENAIYLGFKNDLAFIFHEELSLYEHQSTLNPNMPLRLLHYVSDVLSALVPEEKLYSSKLQPIPTPRFVVLYNGTQEQPEQLTYKLSDAFLKPTEIPELELFVKVYNINEGNNQEMVTSCKTLNEYVQFVSKIRAFAKEYPGKEAVPAAVDYCIEHDILKAFLKRNRAEVIKMSIYTFDEEKVRKMWEEEAREAGHERGLEEGLEQGLVQGFNALFSLVDKGRITEEEAAQSLNIPLEAFREKREQTHIPV